MNLTKNFLTYFRVEVEVDERCEESLANEEETHSRSQGSIGDEEELDHYLEIAEDSFEDDGDVVPDVVSLILVIENPHDEKRVKTKEWNQNENRLDQMSRADDAHEDSRVRRTSTNLLELRLVCVVLD